MGNIYKSMLGERVKLIALFPAGICCYFYIIWRQLFLVINCTKAWQCRLGLELGNCCKDGSRVSVSMIH